MNCIKYIDNAIFIYTKKYLKKKTKSYYNKRTLIKG